jgi:hypothetical protein
MHGINIKLSYQQLLQLYWLLILWKDASIVCIVGFHPPSPCHFAWQPSGASLTNLTAQLNPSRDLSAMWAEYRHHHRPDCTPHWSTRTRFRALTTFDSSLGSLTLPAHLVGDFEEVILLYHLLEFEKKNRWILSIRCVCVFRVIHMWIWISFRSSNDGLPCAMETWVFTVRLEVSSYVDLL